MIGKQISHYKIQEELGRGGMGVVYKAEDTKLKRTVALKFLPTELTRDEDAKERFVHEAQSASTLDHPNICTIYEIDETKEGQMFIAMAYYGGETLKSKIERGPLAIAEAIDIAGQITEGLSRAHEEGIIHRDIKPANILVTKRSEVKIVDFGLAKLAGRTQITKTGTTLGTVAYMSPEQLQGKSVDQRTDIWSLGVMLYEMLTGRLPFKGEYDQAVAYLILNEEPEPITGFRTGVSMELEQIVNKALAKDPDVRYQNVDELLVDLRAVGPELEVVQPQVAPVSAASSRLHRFLLYGGIALLLVLLAVVGRNLFTGGHEPIDSIAVLPMTNRSGDTDQEHIVDGMTDLLINNLSQLGGLERVISHTTMMRYKHSDKSLREIGRELNVDALIEASVLSDREQVLVTVNLIEAETERNLWSTSYERAFRDLLRLEREMALAIAREIEVQLTPQEQTRLLEKHAVDPEALDLYLKGIRQRAKSPVDDDYQWIPYFEQAIAIDSSFAPVHAALAIEYAIAGGLDIRPEVETKARSFAEKALSLDPSLSEPHIAIGLLRELVDWDWAGAEQAFRQAIALNPGDAFAHHELSMLLLRLGRFEEAIAEGKQALYLDPLSARWQSGLGEIYLYSGRYDEAMAEFKKARELNPNTASWYIGLVNWQTGRYEEALKWWEKAKWSERGIARYYAVTGQKEKALQALEEMKARWAQGGADLSILMRIAWVYTDLGEKEQAMDWLERAYQVRLGWLIYVKVDPQFYSLHGEPRFQALLEKMGLDQ